MFVAMHPGFGWSTRLQISFLAVTDSGNASLSIGDIMKLQGILSHEMGALLEALRRDLRAELAKAAGDTCDAHVHHYNARYAVRLLEALNPRGPHRANYEKVKLAA